jgi:hypothetical protein
MEGTPEMAPSQIGAGVELYVHLNSELHASSSTLLTTTSITSRKTMLLLFASNHGHEAQSRTNVALSNSQNHV